MSEKRTSRVTAKDGSSIRMLVYIGVMAAICCVLSPFSIPIGPIPVSLGVVAVLLSVYALGTKAGTIAVLLYLLLGMIGLPVFSGFAGGIGKLLGPTGGYLIGYIFLALISGWFIDRFTSKRWYFHIIGMVVGVFVLYMFGTVWFMIQSGTPFIASLTLCVFPFLPVDAVKIIFCFFFGTAVRKGLSAAHLMEYNR